MPPLKNPFAVPKGGLPDPEAGGAGTGAWGSHGTGGAADKICSQPVSAYGGVTVMDPSLSQKEAALQKKEEELNRREAEIIRREQELQKLGVVVKKRNWPVCLPMVYHDISKDIPADMRSMVRQLYTAYLGLVLCLLFNLVCASVMLGTKQQHRVSSWFLAAIYVATGVPLAFVLWYRRIYNAAKSDGALGYVAFFLLFAVHIGFSIYAAVGFQFSQEKWSFAGFMSAFKAFDINSLVGILYIVGASLWTVEALWSLWCCKQVYTAFRGRGGVQQTQQEVQGVAINAFLQQQHARA